MKTNRSIYIGAVRGVAIYIDVFVLPAFVILCISGGIGFALLFVPVFIVHELSHMLAAYLFEYRICAFTVIPVGGSILLDTSQKQRHSQLVAIYLFAPFVNIMLFCALYAIGIACDALICLQMALINGAFALFSLLPVHPFDGGNVVKELLSVRLNERRVWNVLFAISISASLVLMAAFLLVAVSFGRVLWQIPFAMAFFIYSACMGKRECTASYVCDMINKDSRLKRSVTLYSKCIYVFHTASIAQALRSAGHDTVNIFRIVDDDLNVIGELNEKDMIDATLSIGVNANVCMIDKVKRRCGAYMLL